MIQKNGDFLSIRELNKLISRQLGGSQEILEKIRSLVAEQLSVEAGEVKSDCKF